MKKRELILLSVLVLLSFANLGAVLRVRQLTAALTEAQTAIREAVAAGAALQAADRELKTANAELLAADEALKTACRVAHAGFR